MVDRIRNVIERPEIESQVHISNCFVNSFNARGTYSYTSPKRDKIRNTRRAPGSGFKSKDPKTRANRNLREMFDSLQRRNSEAPKTLVRRMSGIGSIELISPKGDLELDCERPRGIKPEDENQSPMEAPTRQEEI